MEAPAGTPLSAASVWEQQRDFFILEGPRVWEESIVPSYISTNPYLGSFLAEILAAYVAEVGQPVDIIELGAGNGQLGYHILRELGTRIAPGDVRYVLTDLAPSMLDFWRDRARLQPLIESGRLDFARFDIAQPAPLTLAVSGEVLGAEPSRRPVALIASYCFDSVPQDLFYVEDDGRLFECLVQVAQPDGDDGGDGGWPDKDGFTYGVRPCHQPYYDDAGLDAVLAELRTAARGRTVPLPSTAVRSLAFFADRWSGGMLAVIGDRGFTGPEYANALSVVEPTRHGSVSFPVNFGAIGTWFEHRGGEAWHPPRPARRFNVSAFTLDVPGTAARSAYRQAAETRDPDTFFTLKKAIEPHYQELTLLEALALVRLAHWDADIFQALFSHLLDDLAEPPDVITRAELLLTIDRVWETYYPVGEDDLAFRLASLLYAVGEYRLALDYFGRAQEGPAGASVDAWLNCAVCHQLLGQRDEAIACAGQALILAPGLKEAVDLLEELRQPQVP